jgi:hypothetical protein
MNLPRDVVALLDALLAGVQAALAGNLVGVYARGSLAMGEFDPATSDLDVLAATERRVSDGEFAALSALHVRLAAEAAWGRRLEMAYLDRAALRRFVPGQRQATLYQGEPLAWAEHGSNWVLERWTVRQHGVALCGPHPATLIDPIAPAELRAAVIARLPDWDDWANQPHDPDWRLPRRHKAYVVESMCRALYTLATGDLPGKRQAVAWALTALPERWHSLVQRSRSWRTDDTVDMAIVPEVMAFVHWTAQQAQASE